MNPVHWNFLGVCKKKSIISLLKDFQSIPIYTQSKCGQEAYGSQVVTEMGIYSQDEASTRKGKKRTKMKRDMIPDDIIC